MLVLLLFARPRGSTFPPPPRARSPPADPLGLERRAGRGGRFPCGASQGRGRPEPAAPPRAEGEPKARARVLFRALRRHDRATGPFPDRTVASLIS